MKSGVGVLKIATTMESLPVVASFDPCYMTVPIASDEDSGLFEAAAKDDLKPLFEDATAIGIGPGLGQSDELVELMSWAYSRISAPMVVDADALNCLAQNPRTLLNPGGPRILTPHPKEMRRILDDEVSTADDLLYRTESLAREAGVIIVLKGHRSITTNGTERRQNTTGNSGMATGGSGDVLTGIITALLCQGLNQFDAAQLGCLIHGLAGDAAAKRIGKISLTASDIIRYIPKAIRAIRRKERRRERETAKNRPTTEKK